MIHSIYFYSVCCCVFHATRRRMPAFAQDVVAFALPAPKTKTILQLRPRFTTPTVLPEKILSAASHDLSLLQATSGKTTKWKTFKFTPAPKNKDRSGGSCTETSLFICRRNVCQVKAAFLLALHWTHRKSLLFPRRREVNLEICLKLNSRRGKNVKGAGLARRRGRTRRMRVTQWNILIQRLLSMWLQLRRLRFNLLPRLIQAHPDREMSLGPGTTPEISPAPVRAVRRNTAMVIRI